MGRRKIEIQPITHERNRAVTFLKRKNGLFKKAYELGVLCSVDVAVIIFEERPGHQVKLYQYCSGDVKGIVNRHLEFDGERDTKTPHDFLGTKAEEAAADDDDEIEDDDSHTKKEKKDSVKPKGSPNHTSGNAMIIPIRPAQTQSPMQLDQHPSHISQVHRLPTPPGNPVPVLPISNDRLSSEQPSRHNSVSALGGNLNLPLPVPLNLPPSKRPRLDDPQQHHPVVPPPGLTFPYRLDVDLSTYPPAAHATSLPSHTSSSYPHHNAMGLMGMSGHHPHHPHHPNLLSQPFDLSGRPMPYPPLSLEGLFGSRSGAGGVGGGVGAGGAGGGGGVQQQSQAANMLLDLLNLSAGSGVGLNGLNGQAQGGYVPFEWPMTTTSPPQQQQQQQHQQSQQNQQHEVQGVSQRESAAWLEFLTSNGYGGPPTPPSAHRPLFDGPPGTTTTTMSSINSPQISRKRHREASDVISEESVRDRPRSTA